MHITATLFQSPFDVTAPTSTSDLGSAIKSTETSVAAVSELLTPAAEEPEFNSAATEAAADDCEMSVRRVGETEISQGK